MTTTSVPPEAVPDRSAAGACAPPALDVVVPVHNEEAGLAASVRRLHAHLTGGFPYRLRITIADGASTDGTLAVAERLAAELPEVRRAPGREGPRTGAAGGLVRLERAGARVHGRGPVHRPGRAGAAGRAA